MNQRESQTPQAANETGNPDIQTDGLTKVYQTPDGELRVFDDIDLEIFEHEFVSFIGPSGCGKTTLLRILGGLEDPTDGTVYIDGTPEYEPSAKKGFVFQEDVIFPWKTVEENVRYGPTLRDWDETKVRQRVDRFLEVVGLSDYRGYYPRELSGGMRKRVAIAMTFANDPQFLFMDEPFASLDYVTKSKLQNELLEIWRTAQKTTLFVTHDLEEAVYLSDRIFVVGAGNTGIKETIDVPFERPREQSVKSTQPFQELKDDLWEYIK